MVVTKTVVQDHVFQYRTGKLSVPLRCAQCDETVPSHARGFLVSCVRVTEHARVFSWVGKGRKPTGFTSQAFQFGTKKLALDAAIGLASHMASNGHGATTRVWALTQDHKLERVWPEQVGRDEAALF